MKLILKNVRLGAFPNIFEPGRYEDGPEVYSAKFIFPKDGAVAKQVIDAIEAEAKGKWNAKPGEAKRLMLSNKCCLYDGDTKYAIDEEKHKALKGMYYLSARNETKPRVVDRDRNRDLVKADGRPYGGCYVNAIIEVWPQLSLKRVNAFLRGVQFVSDGDTLGPSGSGPASTSDFEQLEGSDDLTDLLG